MDNQLDTRLIDSSASRDGKGNSWVATPVVIFSTLVAVCGSVAFGCASGYSSPAEAGMREDLNMSVAAYSVFGSIITVGGIMGSLVNGKMADLIGRKGAMWVAEIFFVIGWLAIALAQAVWLVDFGRFFTGVAFGILAYVVPVYISEITPKNIRGGFTCISQLMLCLGFSVTFLLGTVISWRFLALIGVIPCVMHVVGLFFIPESPRWLAMLGREIELEATLQRLRGNGVDISQEAADIREYTIKFQGNSKAKFTDLFQRRYVNVLIIGVGIMLVQTLTLGGVSSYMGSIFEEADFPSSIGFVSVALTELPGVVLSAFLADRCGRRPLLLISASGMSLMYFLIGAGFCLQDYDKANAVTPILVYIGLMVNALFFTLGISGLAWVIMSEIFPVKIKATAGSLVTLVHWSSTWVVTYAFNFVFEWSSAGTFFILLGICCLSVLFIAKFVPETKGKSLEELQASITNVDYDSSQ